MLKKLTEAACSHMRWHGVTALDAVMQSEAGLLNAVLLFNPEFVICVTGIHDMYVSEISFHDRNNLIRDITNCIRDIWN